MRHMYHDEGQCWRAGFNGDGGDMEGIIPRGAPIKQWLENGNGVGKPTRSAMSWPMSGTNGDQRLESRLCLSRNLGRGSYIKE